jgi:nucleotide-binding universal stress UspA family protein
MLNKILLADSGTGHSEEMLQYLLQLPSLKNASITILHVVPPQTTSEVMMEKWEEGGKILAGGIQRMHLDPTQVSTILRQGDPKTTVCEIAEEMEADLIIMGSRGLKRLESILENSVSQYVFQLSTRPMLLVKDDIYVTRLKRIMVAVDQSPDAQYCLELALFLLKDIPSGQLLLVQVDPAMEKDEVLSGEQAHQTAVLAPVIEQAKRQGVNYKGIVAGGKPGPTLCEIAEENKVDLLMLGSPERRPTVARTLPDLDRLLGTSLSDYVRVYANCPVLLGRRVS